MGHRFSIPTPTDLSVIWDAICELESDLEDTQRELKEAQEQLEEHDRLISELQEK